MHTAARAPRRPRILTAAAGLALLGTVTITAPAQAFPGGDVDCGEFEYQEDAQAHFDSHPGDPDGLDDNNDGIACESLPHRPTEAPPTPTVYPAAVARDVAAACPSGVVPASGFTDVGASVSAAVDCVTFWQVTSGRTPTSFAPNATVTREQMASFIARTIRQAGGDLPAGGDAFVDDDRSVHQGDINALAKAAVISGTGGGRFSPRAQVTRAQMAKFLTRAYNYRAAQAGAATLPGGADYFGDDDGSSVQGAINAAAAAGFTTGVRRGVYNPGGVVPRGQMAVFLTRVLALLVEKQAATVPAGSDAP